jgi:glutamate-1-semialdehyde 2,1-aminomutase
MVFSRMFGSKPKSEAEAGADPEAEEPQEPEAEAAGEDSADFHWTSRATALIPGGASTGSKRAANLFGGESHLPTHFVRAAGCHLYTADDETLVDCTMALGSVALGYAEPDLTRAVIETLASGSVSGLSPVHEVELAEKFCGVVPCAERVQFLKTGAEAMSAAVRIARTYTGREVVVGCGYFGWHDWCSDAVGVPTATKAAYRKVPFDDIPALERAVSEAGKDLAAIALEPVIERLPSKEWITRARELADKAGAALIFDELKTGFRLATGGYQHVSGVTPDLAAFGKALANGHALSAVCGKEELMAAASKTWISSTLASEAGALAAARVVLAWHEKVDVCAELARIGGQMRDAVANALEASGVSGVSIDGLDQMWLLRFEDPKVEDGFIAAAVRNGVLFKRGAYNFAALAHDEEAIAEIESGSSEAFVEIRDGGRE